MTDGREERYLVHQEVDITVTVRLGDDVAVGIHSHVTLLVGNSGDVVLLHHSDVLLLQTEVVLLVQELEGTRGWERRGEEIRLVSLIGGHESKRNVLVELLLVESSKGKRSLR